VCVGSGVAMLLADFQTHCHCIICQQQWRCCLPTSIVLPLLFHQRRHQSLQMLNSHCQLECC
jgi:hypothetical protein